MKIIADAAMPRYRRAVRLAEEAGRRPDLMLCLAYTMFAVGLILLVLIGWVDLSGANDPAAFG